MSYRNLFETEDQYRQLGSAWAHPAAFIIPSGLLEEFAQTEANITSR